MLKLKELHNIATSRKSIYDLPVDKQLISTINANSYNVAQTDNVFAQALSHSDILLPDGQSVVWACKWLNMKNAPNERITGWDLFQIEMKQLNSKGGKALFLGSSQRVLENIVERAKKDFPSIEVFTYSPPYKPTFSVEETRDMVNMINETRPNLLLVGMTAPKQEKWIYEVWSELNINCHVCCIGAVFDFYANTKKRAPVFMQHYGLEWLFRLVVEPRRLWKRYLIGNPVFLMRIFKEKINIAK